VGPTNSTVGCSRSTHTFDQSGATGRPTALAFVQADETILVGRRGRQAGSGRGHRVGWLPGRRGRVV